LISFLYDFINHFLIHFPKLEVFANNDEEYLNTVTQYESENDNPNHSQISEWIVVLVDPEIN